MVRNALRSTPVGAGGSVTELSHSPLAVRSEAGIAEVAAVRLEIAAKSIANTIDKPRICPVPASKCASGRLHVGLFARTSLSAADFR